MAEPIVVPARLGQPCWTDASLEATVRTIAAMGDESASRFLATHAPMSHVRFGLVAIDDVDLLSRPEDYAERLDNRTIVCG